MPSCMHRISASIAKPGVKPALQAAIALLFLMAIISPPPVWSALQLDTAGISPIFAVVALILVLRPNAGTSLFFVLERLVGQTIGGAMGLLIFYFAYWANDSSYKYTLTKGALTVLFVAMSAFFLNLGRLCSDAYWFAFVMASISVPIVALNAFRLPDPNLEESESTAQPYEVMLYYFYQGWIGITVAALASLFIFPETAADAIRNSTVESINLLGKGTKQLVDLLFSEDKSTRGESNNSSLDEFIDQWGTPVSSSLVKSKALLLPVKTEVAVYHRPHLFNWRAYSTVLTLLRVYLSTLMTLVYLLEDVVQELEQQRDGKKDQIREDVARDEMDKAHDQEGPSSLRERLSSVSILGADNQQGVFQDRLFEAVSSMEECMVIASRLLAGKKTMHDDDNGREGGKLTYARALDRLRDMEYKITSLGGVEVPNLESRVGMLCTISSSPTTDFKQHCSPTQLTAIVASIIFALGSRIRRLYFLLPTMIDYQDPTSVWDTWKHYFKHKSLDFESLGQGDADIDDDRERSITERSLHSVARPMSLPLSPSFPSLLRASNDQEQNILKKGIRDLFHRAGITREFLALSFQVALALAAAAILHVNDRTYYALQERTIWISVTTVVLAQASVGSMMIRSLNRIIGTLIGGALGVVTIYLVFLLNGLSYENNPPKFIFMSVFLALEEGIVMYLSRNATTTTNYTYLVIRFTLPIIALSGYQSTQGIQPEIALWRLINILIGVGLDVVVSTLVFPVTTKMIVLGRTGDALAGLASLNTSTGLSLHLEKTGKSFIVPHYNSNGSGADINGGSSGPESASSMVDINDVEVQDYHNGEDLQQIEEASVLTNSSSGITGSPPSPFSSTADGTAIRVPPSMARRSLTNLREYHMRKERTKDIKKAVIGRPVTRLRPIGLEVAHQINLLAEFEAITEVENKLISYATCKSVKGGEEANVRQEDQAAVRHELRRLLNATLSFTYLLDSPEVKIKGLRFLLPFRQHIDMVTEQLAECLRALQHLVEEKKNRKYLKHRAAVEKLLQEQQALVEATNQRLIDMMKALMREVEGFDAIKHASCSQADVILGFAAIAVLVAAVEGAERVEDSVKRLALDFNRKESKGEIDVEQGRREAAIQRPRRSMAVEARKVDRRNGIGSSGEGARPQKLNHLLVICQSSLEALKTFHFPPSPSYHIMSARGCLSLFKSCLRRSHITKRPMASMFSSGPSAPHYVPATPQHLSTGTGRQYSSKDYNKENPSFTWPGAAADSSWNQKYITQKFPALQEDTSADVVVVGAGIAGLSCAYNLVREGKSVVVLESRVRGAGMTGRTTAHIMTWLDDYYYNAISLHGEEKAKLVADSLRTAVNIIEENCKRENIDCQFTRLDGILYPHEPSSIKYLQKELEASHKCGLTDTQYVDLGGGPDVGGIRECLVFPKNADFHPLMYLDGLAEAITRYGGRIYEGTKAWEVEGDYVKTESGKTIKCEATVLATCSPINHNLAVHARQIPYRSYVVGFLCPKSNFKRADYWDTQSEYVYTRAIDHDENTYLVIVGGGDHKTGFLYDSHNPYDGLEKYARERWTGLGDVVLKWNGQVMEPADALWLHGHDPLVPEQNRFIITGDSGQGMTGGTIGGAIVSDLICGKPNAWADVYSPSRTPPLKSLAEIAEEGVVTSASFAERILPKIELPGSHGIKPGEGKIVQKGVHKVAVYVNDDGKEEAFSAVCPHLGCIVHWNSIEKQFDCPCHGSNFDRHGRLIQGPAKSDLKPFNDW